MAAVASQATRSGELSINVLSMEGETFIVHNAVAVVAGVAQCGVCYRLRNEVIDGDVLL